MAKSKQKHRKPKPKPRPRRRQPQTQTKSRSEATNPGAIVKVEPPAPPVALVRASATVSMIPKVKQTIEDLERVRRFVSTCLNLDLQKWEAKNPYPAQADRDTQKDWEEKYRSLQVDWGTIPGNDKPFLMQPGAEKFLFWLELRPKFKTVERELGDGHLEIIPRVVFYHKRTGEEIFEGPDCSCTTMETNYRYVWAERPDPCTCYNKHECPGCEKKDELKSLKMGRSRKIGEWKRGKKVGERWAWEVRVDNPNIYNERNKVRQIGQKRALVKGVRNMGAISEIFTQPPDEWDIPEEREDTPETEMDYTESGRRIYVDNVSPSGRQVDPKARERKEAEEFFRSKGLWCDKHRCPVMNCPSDEHTAAEHAAFEEAERKYVEEKHRATQAPAQEAQAAASAPKESPQGERTAAAPGEGVPKAKPVPPMQFKGTVEIDCTVAWPIVRGDIQDLLDSLKKVFGLAFEAGPDHLWHIRPTEVGALVEHLSAKGYKSDVKRQPPPKTSKSSSGPKRTSTAESGTSSRNPAEAKRQSSGDSVRTPTAAPVFVSGTIERVNSGMAGNVPKKEVTLIQAGGKKLFLGCFHKSMWDNLAAGLGKAATFQVVTRGSYTNIEKGLYKIGGKEWDEEGKPVIQNRDREAGGKTLFP